MTEVAVTEPTTTPSRLAESFDLRLRMVSTDVERTHKESWRNLEQIYAALSDVRSTVKLREGFLIFPADFAAQYDGGRPRSSADRPAGSPSGRRRHHIASDRREGAVRMPVQIE